MVWLHMFYQIKRFDIFFGGLDRDSLQYCFRRLLETQNESKQIQIFLTLKCHTLLSVSIYQILCELKNNITENKL